MFHLLAKLLIDRFRRPIATAFAIISTGVGSDVGVLLGTITTLSTLPDGDRKTARDTAANGLVSPTSAGVAAAVVVVAMVVAAAAAAPHCTLAVRSAGHAVVVVVVVVVVGLVEAKRRQKASAVSGMGVGNGEASASLALLVAGMVLNVCVSSVMTAACVSFTVCFGDATS